MLLREKNVQCQIEQTRLCFYPCSLHTSQVHSMYFLHWLISVDLITFLLMVSRITLLILFMFDLDDFIKRMVFYLEIHPYDP